MNFKLSKREQIIFDFMREKRNASLDEITAHVSKKARKKVDRKAVTVNIRYLVAKIASTGWFIQQVAGGRGAGNKSHFQLGRVK